MEWGWVLPENQNKIFRLVTQVRVATAYLEPLAKHTQTMADQKQEIDIVLRRAEEILQTARHGYEDLVRPERSRRFTGLRNLIVFGRSVTLVLQNLKSVVSEQAFNKWYLPKQDEMRQDPLLRYFVTARNEILKQGKLNVSTSTQIHCLTGGDFKKFGPPPPGAKGFFIGDQAGGAGWEIELPDGKKEKYYIDLPSGIGEVKQRFTDLPEATEPELKGKSIEELCSLYLIRLETIIDDARRHFGAEEIQRLKGRRLSPYLKVIK